MLQATAVPGSDYINASFIDVREKGRETHTCTLHALVLVELSCFCVQGYRQRGAYIATQTPMENTVNDFWKMIWEYQSRSIVMLCRMQEDGKVTVGC